MIRGIEYVCCDERLRELGLLSLKKILGRSMVAFQYLKRPISNMRTNFLAGPFARRRGNGFKNFAGRLDWLTFKRSLSTQIVL